MVRHDPSLYCKFCQLKLEKDNNSEVIIKVAYELHVEPKVIIWVVERERQAHCSTCLINKVIIYHGTYLVLETLQARRILNKS